MKANPTTPVMLEQVLTPAFFDQLERTLARHDGASTEHYRRATMFVVATLAPWEQAIRADERRKVLAEQAEREAARCGLGEEPTDDPV